MPALHCREQLAELRLATHWNWYRGSGSIKALLGRSMMVKPDVTIMLGRFAAGSFETILNVLQKMPQLRMLRDVARGCRPRRASRALHVEVLYVVSVQRANWVTGTVHLHLHAVSLQPTT